MAGYIFTLDSFDSLKEIIRNGVYSTNLKISNNTNWLAHHEGTFADYLSMKEGDNVYFFIKRRIYGVGKLVNINGDCKHLNFPEADNPQEPDYSQMKDMMILNRTAFNLGNRFICTFEGAPAFFQEGIDMDDVLTSNPAAFKMLRVLWKLSFIKIDDVENKALYDIILMTNEEEVHVLGNVFEVSSIIHNRVEILHDEKYNANASTILELSSNGELIKHEMAIETGIIDEISKNTGNIFGHWDYLSHQVVASPFKPVDYMDKMDIFGYKFIPGYDTISKYLVIEIKKDGASVDVVHQIMKYVDWVNQEYSFGNYNMIEAYIVAKDFSRDVIDAKQQLAKRFYIKGRRPAISAIWNNLRLIKYKYNSDLRVLEFEEVI